MSDGVVLRVEGLAKKFSRGLRGALWNGVRDIGQELAWWRRPRASALRPGEFWALREVSFALRRGEALGVLGGNGAGKSTLLKVLSGLLKPDAGRVHARGRVRAIIELGAAFHPALSGRENIFAQAALYGHAQRDLRRHLDAIIDFAGIGEFLDAPLQHYSSGMRARLGFAIAVHLSPDVLLVDEVLAVGDIAFQHKCLQHMRDYLAEGGALVFVGHATHQVQAVCTRGLVLERGAVTFAGGVVEALECHLRQQRVLDDGHDAATLPPALPAAPLPALRAPDAGDDTPVRIDAVTIDAADGGAIATGGTLRLAVRYTARRPVSDVQLIVTLFAADGQSCVGGGHPPQAVTLEPGTHVLACVLPRLPLHGGTYLLRAALFDARVGFPLALSGWEDAPHRVDVQAEPTLLANLHALIGMRVGLETRWAEDPGDAPRPAPASTAATLTASP